MERTNRSGKGIVRAALARSVILLIAGGFTAATAAPASDVSLFVRGMPSEVVTAPWSADRLPGAPPALRARNVTVAEALTRPGYLSRGETLLIPLFHDAGYRATVDRLTTNVNGTFTVRARIHGFPHGYLLLSSTGERTLGVVRVPEQQRRFAIVGAGADHHLLEVDESAVDVLESAPPLIAPFTPGPVRKELAADEWDPATVDVMVVYTPAAADWAETPGNGGMANVIAQAMEKAQLVNDNSHTLLTLNLVYSAEVGYAEAKCVDDLLRLTNPGDGHMDEVHLWRDQYGGDLVALFTRTDDCGGIAWQLGEPAGSPTHGFSLTRVQHASSTYTHIHEMGHNMGAHHHKEQNFQPGPGVFPYSAGWRWVGTDAGRYCDVMTYTSGSYFPDGQTHTQVAHFSNPSVTFAGVATGHPQDGDNARTVRATKHAVAGYRVGDTELRDGVPVTGISPGSTETFRYFYLDLPAGVSTLEFAISGGTGNADLYVRRGSEPTLWEWECRPHLPGNDETCSFPDPTSGRWWVGLYPGPTYEGLTLAASYYTEKVAAPALDPDGGVQVGASVMVTVTCATPDAVIRYTTDGREPTEADPAVDSGEAVSVPVPGTLKARAWKAGMAPSDTSTAHYRREGGAGAMPWLFLLLEEGT